ncbi:FAD-dependent oxidoreductase [Acinetobacter johnsonii]|uniref:NAD(P)/FAD-dependent oxidoreductase n=1 Tax=Acinetobacter johnsonii TaxID=40214 RepID=UPI00244B83CF|nr:FAD-dependent oxidoreductase [Acinetobacter johnsonii]MDH1699643.1 FAD-dependent oxidoreductase [Acinetobacter johnsonii]
MDIRDINKVVIVGAGQAGGMFALNLRQEGFQGEVLVIGEEKHLPYERPQLSKEVLLKAEDDVKLIRQLEDYKNLNIELMLDKKVIDVKTEVNELVINDSTSIKYDVLVVATGVKARELPEYQNEKCVSVRFIEDSLKIKSKLKANNQVLIVGGGVIGLEVANAAIQKGCEVIVVEIGNQLMGRSLDEDVSQIVKKFHENNGIKIQLNTSIQEMNNKEVKLSNGQVLTPDLIVLGVGVQANNDFLKNSNIFTEGGIEVNQYSQTKINNVFAIGDIALQNPKGEGLVRIETWQNAQNQALNLAKFLTKSEVINQEPCWFWSDQGALNIQVIGDVKSSKKILRKIDDFKMTYLYVNDSNELIGCVTINNPKEMSVAKKIVGKNKVIDSSKVLDVTSNLKNCFIG